jgi:hypothetical protein
LCLVGFARNQSERAKDSEAKNTFWCDDGRVFWLLLIADSRKQWLCMLSVGFSMRLVTLPTVALWVA